LDRLAERIASTPVSERKFKCQCGNDYDGTDYFCNDCRIFEKIKNTIPLIYIKSDTERDYRPYIQNSVFCFGPAGTGKTQFVATLAKDIIKSGKRVVWYSFPTLVMKMQCAYRNDKIDPFELTMETAKDSAAIVFDDIGIEKMTDFVRQTVYMLINERYQRQLQTLITSNRSLSDIDNLIHPGIASRIAGMCDVLEFRGRDFRIKK
jgi:DNA replication protein DnaC